jgi:hypothetical protein
MPRWWKDSITYQYALIRRDKMVIVFYNLQGIFITIISGCRKGIRFSSERLENFKKRRD